MNKPRAYLLLGTLLALIVAVPVVAGTGGGKDNAPGQQKDKTPKSPITLNGTIEKSTAAGEDGKGPEAVYTLTDGGKTYTLEAGPSWFFETGKHPLDPYVGENVKVEGEVAEGSTDVEVISVDGKALREPGKPPWAGGWKVVGERHPGWSQEKADRMKAKFGDCFPPGQCKDKSNAGKNHSDDEPGASETPDSN
jgi:hypothetical protein